MSWFSSGAASAYISPVLSAMSIGTQAWQSSVTSWTHAVQGCADALTQVPKKANALTVFVGAGALRATVLGAECGARSLAEYQALAQQQFAKHGAAAQDWAVQCALISPRVGALAVALPEALLAALRQWAARARIQRLSVQPAFLAPIRAAASRLAPRANAAWAMVLAEPGALVTLQTVSAERALVDRALVDRALVGPALVLGIQTSPDANALPREQTRARFAAGPSCTLHTWQLQTAAMPAAPGTIAIAGLHFVPQHSSTSESAT